MQNLTVSLTGYQPPGKPGYLNHYLFVDPVYGTNFTYPNTANGSFFTTASYPVTADGGLFFPWGYAKVNVTEYVDLGALKGPYNLIFSTSALDTSFYPVFKILYDFGDGEYYEIEKNVVANYTAGNLANILAGQLPENIQYAYVDHEYWPLNNVCTVYTPSVSVIFSNSVYNIYNITFSSYPDSIYSIEKFNLLNKSDVDSSGRNNFLVVESRYDDRYLNNFLLTRKLSTLDYTLYRSPTAFNYAYVTYNDQQVYYKNSSLYLIVSTGVNIFSLTNLDSGSAYIVNGFDPYNYANCRLFLSTSANLSANKSNIVVGDYATLSSSKNNFFTINYFTTGSLILGFSPNSVYLPPVTSYPPFPNPTPTPTPTPTIRPTSTPRPTATPSPTPTITPAEYPLNFLSAVKPSEFSIYATNSGGNINYAMPFLSGTLAAPASTFDTPSLITLTLPKFNNSYYFATNTDIFQFINYLSVTGSRNFGFDVLDVNKVVGGTDFAGINSISGMELNSSNFLPHLPFAIFNNAVYLSGYRNSYLQNITGNNYNNFSISIQVPAFEKTVNGKTYKLKTFLLEQNSFSVPSNYDLYGNPISYNTPDTFVEIVPLSSITNKDLLTNSNLSAVLLNAYQRQPLTPYNSFYPFVDALSTQQTYELFSILSSVSISSFFGYASRPLFYSVPIKYNNKWGYLINSTTNTVILTTLSTQGFTFSVSANALSPTVTWSGSAYYETIKNLYFIPTGIVLTDLYPLTSTQSVSNDRNLLSFQIPADDKYERIVVSYYAN